MLRVDKSLEHRKKVNMERMGEQTNHPPRTKLTFGARKPRAARLKSIQPQETSVKDLLV